MRCTRRQTTELKRPTSPEQLSSPVERKIIFIIAVQDSCVCGASAARTPLRGKLAASANTRATAAQTSDVLSRKLCCSVCTAKPIERERCHGSSNHLMELLSWNIEGQGPREHCPCAGDLQCEHLSRGSLCLKRQNSSEEDLTDAVYSEIGYIV
ncbi:dickkopf-related protein 3-like [Oncorhynchus keta]|uniref:dickkopf-related protein 3-like n=1 Tax=Oncorhynchus keta TaxID=8018 RepID=UPI00227C1999|nr:dickkopf-related protein 3-like [Oncorhynchus keta]XP_052337420.1 dickkopf-related protein 3-like [Oncorhynchus keta]XP_052337423.1 dickkopf-related protein 3-like [Oncorhynchus keta]